MRRTNITLLVTLLAVLGLVTSHALERAESSIDDSDSDSDSEAGSQAIWERDCYDLASKGSKFKDPKFYKRVFGDLFGKNTAQPELVVRFYLFKKAFPLCGEDIRVDDDSVQRSGFNASHPTRFLIHGWMSQSKAGFSRLTRNAYLSVGDFNVIVVDWSVASQTANYFRAAKLVEDVGELVANFAKHLKKTMGVDYDDVYLIGHSLGAHIAGSAGKRIQPEKFNTIFALDPAGPAFRGKPVDSVIDASDAKYVESIQTSGSLGVGQPVGHATFFPNKGIYQGCLVYGCAHRKSYKYFAESITSNRGFWGTQCFEEKENKWECPERGTEYKMGGEPSEPKNGTFYVKTASSSPYALGKRSKYLYA